MLPTCTKLLTRLRQECLRQPVFCGSPHQIFGFRRHSWKRQMSNVPYQTQAQEEFDMCLRLLWGDHPSPHFLINTLFITAIDEDKQKKYWQ
ncbi:hypothetical protein L873DRAFT_1115216 [Choiromyces venosus 120613-1]|uniref:Uncharacterized protein n=1 Tax=Choiromyces venosus 120613-1 TaxID=1336337 RepID=A0A3N4JJZ7_9PEZI|nr:hypothetical protein L873DRAFT_1115216 [Choiromyces venosus 120613-1]